jgi:hypothetical protein
MRGLLQKGKGAERRSRFDQSTRRLAFSSLDKTITGDHFPAQGLAGLLQGRSFRLPGRLP